MTGDEINEMALKAGAGIHKTGDTGEQLIFLDRIVSIKFAKLIIKAYEADKAKRRKNDKIKRAPAVAIIEPVR